MINRKRTVIPYLYLAVPILLWSATPLLVTELSKSIPVFEINFISTAFSIAALALVCVASGKWHYLGKYSAKDYRIMTLMGVTGIFPYTTLYYLAFSLAPASAGNINIVNYLWPIWILVLSAFLLKEPLTWRKLAGVLLSFAGVYLIVSGGAPVGFQAQNSLAYVSAGCGAFFWALFSVISKRTNYDALSSMVIYNAAALVCFFLVAILFSKPVMPSGRSWLLLLLLGGCVNGFGYLSWILALRKGATAKIANAVYLTPFVALVYLFLFRGHPITLIQLLSLALILAGPLVQGRTTT
jgi:drug/metabolite transporter (DMT)-like permease